jgi:enoyl-CoA hydratase/carnithine racemase
MHDHYMRGEVLYAEESGVATLTLSAPGRKNALSVAMWRQLRAAILDLQATRAARVLVIRGAGSDFCAGADISEFNAVRHDRNSGEIYHEEIIRPTLEAVLACKLPVVAAIRGHCVGGGLELAACCDLRVAADDASLGAPVLYRGFPLAPFEMACVMAAFGKSASLQLLLEGTVIDAREAFGLQMLHHVYADRQFDAQLALLTARLASAAPLAVAATKRMANMLAPVVSSFSLAEQHSFYAFLDSADYQEGIAAFLEKRIAKFSGS